MSKSVGNVIDPFDLADAYGVDQFCYFFLREVPFGQDGNYSHEAIVNRINADLANDLGNLAQRSLSMIARQLNGALPKPGAFSEAGDILQPLQADVIGKDAIVADLFDLARGTVSGRRAPDEITFFKSVGAAIEDLAAAIAVMEAAKP